MKIALIFGGRSAEHEVSVTSARCIWQAMSQENGNGVDNQSAELIAIGIDHQGQWWLLANPQCQFDAGEVRSMEADKLVHMEPGKGLIVDNEVIACDVVFPILHGTFGEDGSIQGLFEMIGLPYVGAGVLGSSVAMDKGVARAAFAAHNLLQPDYEVFTRYQWSANRQQILDRLNQNLQYPLFVKPCNLGSSVGISKVDTQENLSAAIELAARFDNRIIVESGILDCAEIECGVIGNEQLKVSPVGEIIPGDKFYSYDDKYVNNASQTKIPATLTPSQTEAVRKQAIKAYRALDIAGLARVDFFVRGENVYINEINTLPGFTPISMFPQLWVHGGLSYRELIVELCNLALERFEAKKALTTERFD